MATIHNQSLLKNLIDKIKLQLHVDKVPTQLAEKIIPVINIEDKTVNILRDGATATTGTHPIHIIPAGYDFYLTGLHLGISKDVLCDNLSLDLQVTIDGSMRLISRIRTETLTAGSWHIVRDFSNPIKLDRGSTINMVGVSTAGAMFKHAQIQGIQTLI